MNKFKKILLGVASVLTLGALFTVTGVKSNADTMITTLDYSTGSLSKNGDLTVTSSVGSSYDYVNFTTTGYIDNTSTKEYDKGVKFGSNKYVQFVAEYNYEVKILWCTRNEAKNFKLQATITPAEGDSIVEYSNQITGSTSETIFDKFELSGNVGDTVKIERNSNECILIEIVVIQTGTQKTDADYIEEAEAAIDAIGEVKYLQSSKTLIDNAETAISKVSSTSSISNYSDYTLALSTFNSLKAAAISDFTTAVTNIGTVTVNSGSSIETAETAYEVLFGDALNDSTVVSSKSIFDTKKAQYLDLVYDTLDKTINANSCDLATDGVTAETQCANSIFSLMPTAKVNTCNEFTFDGITYSRRIQTAGNVAFNGNEVSNKAVKFNTKSAGVLKILAQSAKSGDTSRTLSIFASGSKTAIYTTESGLPDTTSSVEYNYISIPSAGTYYIASSVNSISIYYAEFIPESVTPLVQEATDTDYTYVRFVTIVKGVEEISSDDVTFSITMEYTDESTKTVNYTPYVVKKITQNGAAYVANVGTESHTFDNAINATEYYVVYVIRFTTSKFTGCKVSATTTFAGVDYTSSQVTI